MGVIELSTLVLHPDREILTSVVAVLFQSPSA
jgi:hypothetical protein